MSKSSWRWVRLGGSLLAGALLAWWLLKQDWGTLWAALSRLSWPVLLAAFVLYWTGIAFNAARWYTVLHGMKIKISGGKALRLTFAGAFASNFLPSTVGGDTLRVLGLLGGVTSASVAEAVTSVVVDRLLNVVAMYTFLPLTWLTYGATFRQMLPFGDGGGLFLLLPPGLQAKLQQKLQSVGSSLATLRRSPQAIGQGFALAWLSLLPPFTATWLIAQALGIPVSWYEVAGTTVITYTITLLPIAFNGYGVREISLAALYPLLGATPAQALTLALVTRFLMAATTLTGALWVGEAVPR